MLVESKKLCVGFYRLVDGRNVVYECPITDGELAAYRRHPTTFFGVVKKQGQAKTPKEKLLEFMSDAP